MKKPQLTKQLKARAWELVAQCAVDITAGDLCDDLSFDQEKLIVEYINEVIVPMLLSCGGHDESRLPDKTTKELKSKGSKRH